MSLWGTGRDNLLHGLFDPLTQLFGQPLIRATYLNDTPLDVAQQPLGLFDRAGGRSGLVGHGRCEEPGGIARRQTEALEAERRAPVNAEARRL